MGFSPGPHFQTILKQVEEAQLGGELSNREEAMDWVNKKLRQRGQEMKTSQAYKVVGRPEARLDGADKVTGKRRFIPSMSNCPVWPTGKFFAVPMPMLGSNESMPAKRRRFRESMLLSPARIKAGSGCSAPHIKIRPSSPSIRCVMWRSGRGRGGARRSDGGRKP